MMLVVDTNVLFSFFWEGSATRKILMSQWLELFSPEYGLEEINNHMDEIIEKAKISKKRFISLRRELAGFVRFVPVEDYKGMLKAALNVSPDSADVDFFALALMVEAPLWSNDRLLKAQRRVLVVSTDELIEMPEFLDGLS